LTIEIRRKLKRIALISDTHSYFGEEIKPYVQDCDELWHAGDIGNMETADQYESLGIPFRAVYGNIDDHVLRRRYQETLDFEIENVHVLMIHIGGYPGKYSPKAKQLIFTGEYKLFIAGHSHIAKVIYDKQHDLLHMNPGAFGKSGFHTIRTMIRFSIENSSVFNAELIEFAKR